MNTDRNRIFEQLDAPAGGVERLRERLHHRDKQPWVRRHWRPAAAFALVIAVAVASLIRLSPEVVDANVELALYQAPEFDRLLGRVPEPVELSVERNRQGVEVVALESSDPKIRIYALD